MQCEVIISSWYQTVYFLRIFFYYLHNSECGTTVIQDNLVKEMVINGRDASIEEWPMYGKLQVFGSAICGATLIHPDWAVTATHCLFG